MLPPHKIDFGEVSKQFARREGREGARDKQFIEAVTRAERWGTIYVIFQMNHCSPPFFDTILLKAKHDAQAVQLNSQADQMNDLKQEMASIREAVGSPAKRARSETTLSISFDVAAQYSCFRL